MAGSGDWTVPGSQKRKPKRKPKKKPKEKQRRIEEEVNFLMMNMHNSKTKRMVCAIIVVILVLAMVAPMALSALL